MKGKESTGALKARLRKMAERMLDTGQYEPDAIEPANLDDLTQELHIYHAELEIQNEQLRRTQHDLEQVSQRYQSLFELAPVGYVVLENQGRIVEANQQARNALDLDLTQNLLGTPFSIYLAPSDRMTWQRHLQACLATGQGHRCEVQLRGESDREVHVLLVSKVLPTDEPDHGHRILVSLTDITQRKEIEKRVQGLKNQFEAFMEHLPAGAFVCGEDRQVRFVNRFMREQLGAEAPGEDRPGLLAQDLKAHRRLVAHGEEVQEPVELVDVHGRHRVFQCARFPIVLPDQGGLTGGVLLDMTRLKEAETRRRRMEKQLRQSMKLESIGRLAGGMAHDFNNQLTVIQGYCEMLVLSEGLSDPARRQLGEIARAANRAHALTDQLLSFSRRQMLMPEKTDLNDLLASILPEVRSELGPDVVVRYEPGEDLPPIQIDRGQFKYAVRCLVRNAGEALEGQGQFMMRTGQCSLASKDLSPADPAQPGTFLYADFEDTGCGIPKSALPNIFEPFFTTRSVGKGAGLGLSMVHGFVLQSGGKIDVKTSVGQGTRLRIFLPLTPLSESWDPLLAVGDLPGGDETLLLVEPDPQLLTMISARLREVGYTVLEARDGAQALLMAEEEHGPINLLVTAGDLPDVTPAQLAGRLEERIGSKAWYRMEKPAEPSARSDPKTGLVRSVAVDIRKLLDGENVDPS
jgi:PAS domain S-box-containing protein